MCILRDDLAPVNTNNNDNSQLLTESILVYHVIFRIVLKGFIMASIVPEYDRQNYVSLYYNFAYLIKIKTYIL